MKTNAYICVLNERDYLEYCVRSLVDWVEKLYIVEMATQYAPLQQNGLSVDGTGEIAKRLCEEFDNIEYIPYGIAENRKEVQNFILNKIPVGDLLIHSGADMIWYSSSSNFKKYMEEHSDVTMVYPDIYDMISWEKYYNAGIDSGFRAPLCCRKSDEGFHYVDVSGIVDKQNRIIFDFPYKSVWSLKENIGLRCIHLSCICSKNKFLLKQVHLNTQNKVKSAFDLLSENKKKEIIEETYTVDARMLRLCGNQDDKIFGLPIYKIDKLPEVILSHPYMKYKEIWEIPNEEIYQIK